MDPTLVDKSEILLPLLIFQVSFGVKDGFVTPELIGEIQLGLKTMRIEGFRLQFLIVLDHDSNKSEFKLLWPINNSLISEKDLLDLLTKHGYVPPRVVEDIQIEIHNK